MLLGIQVRPEDIIEFNKRMGRIIVRVKHYGTYAHGASLWTVRGETMEDYQSRNALGGKSVLISGRGGISTGQG